MSVRAMDRLRGATTSILLGLEPRYYVKYNEDLLFYEYNPLVEGILPNPLLEHLSRNDATEIANELRERVTRQLSAHNPDMLQFYRGLLLP
jgi:hypothetical protein